MSGMQEQITKEIAAGWAWVKANPMKCALGVGALAFFLAGAWIGSR